MTTDTANGYVMPRVNIYESNDDVRIEAELPGVAKDGIEIEIKDNELVLTAKRAQNGEKGTLRFRERSSANFRRSFMLGKAVDTGKVDATMHDGVLKITLHKAERAKSRKIAIA
jgi:HSP20 family protein